jgi:hypothetical protein
VFYEKEQEPAFKLTMLQIKFHKFVSSIKESVVENFFQYASVSVSLQLIVMFVGN